MSVLAIFDEMINALESGLFKNVLFSHKMYFEVILL